MIDTPATTYDTSRQYGGKYEYEASWVAALSYRIYHTCIIRTALKINMPCFCLHENHTVAEPPLRTADTPINKYGVNKHRYVFRKKTQFD